MASIPHRVAWAPALAEDNVSCSSERQFAVTVPLPTQLYKWVRASLTLGLALQWTSLPSRGVFKYSLSLHATETGREYLGLMGHLTRMQNYRLPY